ncbi:MAG: SRPBCC family protein [Chloroflexi bacterium]|nr:SRPBCC family protein [Chloroflexota bacterium]
MTLIDQRILIDAPPQVIWEFLADPAKVPQWHAGYRIVSVLTTRQTGAGIRRRCALVSGGKDIIEEITAWVDGVGYEYHVTEGGAQRHMQGRFRLQPSPEGTSVQWTLSYQPRGIFGAIKNQLRGRRQQAEMMANSLRQLRRRVDEMGQRMQAEERNKVAIRGRLNAEERAHYQRRHGTTEPVVEGSVPPPPPSAFVPTLEALPVPTPDAAMPPAAPPPMIASPVVPSFVAELTAEPPMDSHTADTEPKVPPGLREAIKAKQEMQVVDPLAAAPEALSPAAPQPAVPPVISPAPEPPRREITPPAFIQPAAPESQRPTPARGIPSIRPPVPPAAAEPPARVELDAAPPVVVPPPTPLHDTGEISIWEVFGMRRPSEQAQEVLDDLIRTVRSKQTAEMQRVIVDRRFKRPSRVRRLGLVVGLRLKLALKQAHVRLHGK